MCFSFPTCLSFSLCFCYILKIYLIFYFLSTVRFIIERFFFIQFLSNFNQSFGIHLFVFLSLFFFALNCFQMMWISTTIQRQPPTMLFAERKEVPGIFMWMMETFFSIVNCHNEHVMKMEKNIHNRRRNTGRRKNKREVNKNNRCTTGYLCHNYCL